VLRSLGHPCLIPLALLLLLMLLLLLLLLLLLRTYLPLFTRTMRLLESRLDPATGLFLIGDAANLLAPSAGAWLLPNGTRAPAWLTGVSVSYAAAMDRVVELRRLVGDDVGAARDAAKRDAAIAALPQVRNGLSASCSGPSSV